MSFPIVHHEPRHLVSRGPDHLGDRDIDGHPDIRALRKCRVRDPAALDDLFQAPDDHGPCQAHAAEFFIGLVIGKPGVAEQHIGAVVAGRHRPRHAGTFPVREPAGTVPGDLLRRVQAHDPSRKTHRRLGEPAGVGRGSRPSSTLARAACFECGWMRTPWSEERSSSSNRRIEWSSRGAGRERTRPTRVHDRGGHSRTGWRMHDPVAAALGSAGWRVGRYARGRLALLQPAVGDRGRGRGCGADALDLPRLAAGRECLASEHAFTALLADWRLIETGWRECSAIGCRCSGRWRPSPLSIPTLRQWQTPGVPRVRRRAFGPRPSQHEARRYVGIRVLESRQVGGAQHDQMCRAIATKVGTRGSFVLQRLM